MTAEATIFKSNRSQAVRIPKDFAFPDGLKRVFIRRVGKSLILTPIEDFWDSFFDKPGIDIEEPPDLPVQERDPL